jgi:hypothetical protein
MKPILVLPRTALLVATTLAGFPDGIAAASRPVVLVPTNAMWRYLDDGSDQGTSWRELFYDDDAWSFGRAELGYGDAVEGRPEQTLISFGPDPAHKHITTYFRRFFYASNAPTVTNLVVRLMRDDGGIVYLNGQEVFRSNMLPGPVNSQTLTPLSGASGADEYTFFATNADPAVLVSGINLLAVEIHQNLPTTTDLSFDLELLAYYPSSDPTNPPPVLTRGPYLQNATPTNLVVRWRTAEPSASSVQFGRTADALNWAVFDPAPTTEHVVTLTNLAPDTQYFYAIGDGVTHIAGGAEYHFVTTPLRPRPTRIWAIGDAGTANLERVDWVRYGQLEVRDAYYTFAGPRRTDVWLILGDNAYGNGLDHEYQTNLFQVYPDLLRQAVFWSTIGNHDVPGPYYDIFSFPKNGEAGGVASGTEAYYSFDYGNIHFVCLDSEVASRLPGGPMLTWLEEDLAANSKDWLIAFWHEPPYSRGSHNSDNLNGFDFKLVQMRENAVPILEAHGVDLVLCGHSHSYERSMLLDGHYGFSRDFLPSMALDAGSGRPEDSGAYLKPNTGPNPHEGAVYVVAGSSGWVWPDTGLNHPAMFVGLPTLGSLVIDVDGHRLDAKFLTDTGRIADSFTIIKGTPAEPLRFATFRVNGATVACQFKTVAGGRYQVEKSASLDDPEWFPASEVIVATGATSRWTTEMLPDQPKCFYRIVKLD